ncbi:hypothetical protein JF732_18905 [Mycobacterium intracellulare]|uniref:PE family protein n=1 Tax=Mycobacterium intracellulare TaxID=1767 RepID=A0AAE4RGN5_MYCIT|nr:hypothetical protein [Mycobacterium intracellulare]MCA2320692.1 hypothetical protein [Mycobacterium intracellulare]MCA2342612.1 hypothetical protein [Mycobacterium intracellulare]MDV6978198.1 hypothetical protein [Mycobacterium intracellulare]MDV6983601.1 hypothetical protein [Mycobacterium intracellulare]MDV7013704.1 hypothetical protein [Mycobacterium intracellulare]
MGQDALQVIPAELAATAGQWQALSSQLVGAPPSPGQPFQATTAAVNAVNGAIGVTAASFAARTQETVGGVTTAAGGYTAQEATAAGQMSNITGVTVV